MAYFLKLIQSKSPHPSLNQTGLALFGKFPQNTKFLLRMLTKIIHLPSLSPAVYAKWLANNRELLFAALKYVLVCLAADAPLSFGAGNALKQKRADIF